MSVLTPSCGHHCGASRVGAGKHVQTVVRHCPCAECQCSSSGVITSAVGSPLTIAVGWGDAVGEGVAIVEEGRKDQAALDEVKQEMVDEAVADLHRDLGD